MTRIGLVTIGQSPRDDLISEIRTFIPNSVSIVQAGALDQLSSGEITSHCPVAPEKTLVTQLTDGSEVRVDKDFVHTCLQQTVHSLEKEVELIGLLCSGTFPDLVCKVPLLLPYQLLKGSLPALSFPGRWGVLVPSSDQTQPIQAEIEEWGIKAVVKAVSPYTESEYLGEVVCSLIENDVSAILLNCFGYTLGMKATVQMETHRPVISVRSLFAHVLAELIA